MTRKITFILTIAFLFVFQGLFAQNAIDETIKTQAEKLSTSVYEGNYEALVKYTHPNIVRALGGKEAMIRAVKASMADFENGTASLDRIEIGDDIVSKRYKNEYHALIPKTITITAKGQQVTAKSYLFGFSNADGKAWTFVEAKKLQSAAGKKLFPNFETDIKIPDAEDPEVIENEGLGEVLEFDENAGTYSNSDEVVDDIFGWIGLYIGISFLLVLIAAPIFFIIYKNRKKRKQEELPVVSPKPIVKKIEKISCSKCQTENSSEAKYCKQCGYALVSHP